MASCFTASCSIRVRRRLPNTQPLPVPVLAPPIPVRSGDKEAEREGLVDERLVGAG